MPHEVYDSFIAAIDKGNIKSMPNRSMPASPYPTPGALLMGDAFNMRHPLTGGGMTVALSDIVVLRNLLRPLRDLSDGASLCKYLESFYTLRKVKHQLYTNLWSIRIKIVKLFCCQSMNQCLKMLTCSQWQPQLTPLRMLFTKCSVHQKMKQETR